MLRTAVDKLKEENKNMSLERTVTNTDDKVILQLLTSLQNYKYKLKINTHI